MKPFCDQSACSWDIDIQITHTGQINTLRVNHKLLCLGPTFNTWLQCIRETIGVVYHVVYLGLDYQ